MESQVGIQQYTMNWSLQEDTTTGVRGDLLDSEFEMMDSVQSGLLIPELKLRELLNKRNCAI